MKNSIILYVSVIIISIIIASCSKSDDLQYGQQSLASEQDMSEALMNLNSTIVRSLSFTRGDKPEKQKDTVKVNVVEADFYGALVGAYAGWKAKNPNPLVWATITVGAIAIGAACASIAAAAQNGYVVFNGNNENCDILNEWVSLPNSMTIFKELDSSETTIMYNKDKLSMPQKYFDAQKIGIMHNAILERMPNKVTVKEYNKNIFSQSEIALLNENKSVLQEIISNSRNWKEAIMQTDSSNIIKIANSFMSVYGSCIENKDKYEALQTLYAYIDFVDKRNDLNENEKECILIGLNVAWA